MAKLNIVWPWSRRGSLPDLSGGDITPLTDAERRMNQQATMIAASVLGEPVEAATRCQHRVFETKRQTR